MRVPPHVSFAWLIAFAVVGVRLEAADPAISATKGLAFNSEGNTYDSRPSTAIAPDGRTWIAWHAYHGGRDQVLARSVDSEGGFSPVFTVSEKGTTHSSPVLVAGRDVVWVTWCSLDNDTWTVKARRFASGQWHPEVDVSTGADAVHPTAHWMHGDRLVIAWSEYDAGHSRTRMRVHADDSWTSPVSLSTGEFDAQRPTTADDADGRLYVFWDEYKGKHFSVFGRMVLPEIGPVEMISPAGEHCLSPTALGTSQGLVVAWLRKVDVMGGPGVISQWHTLHAARSTSDGWSVLADEAGNTVAGELTQGLMAQISPRPIATGGYLGRRTTPMLIEVDGRLWLMWERKSDHTGSTWRVHGDLIGRPLEGGVWRDPAVLLQGLVDYHVVQPDDSTDGRFPVIASALPRQTRRIYRRITCDVSDATEYQQDLWEGWVPVQLPVAEQLPTRHQIQIGNKSYQLYWADLHCHSGLTADAEGEPDELMHYARDRARLDVVVFTNNDFLYDVPLTQYEYAMNTFLGHTYNRPGFLVLPGYEWTSRIPGIRSADVSDPGNWTPPYRNDSYPNHRSVIYPHEGGPLLRYSESANDIARLNAAVSEAGGITMTQHEAFQATGHPVEVAMEMTSGWRRYIARRPDQFHGPLNEGQRLGFVACGDTHRRAPGLSGALTGIYAEELSDEAILDALRTRRCFATSGSRIFVDSRANGSFMGRETEAEDGQVQLTLDVVGIGPIERVTLIRDGIEIESFDGDGTRELSCSHADADLPPGQHWYYWRIAQSPNRPDLPGNLNPAFGHLAWSSPHWVLVK